MLFPDQYHLDFSVIRLFKGPAFVFVNSFYFDKLLPSFIDAYSFLYYLLSFLSLDLKFGFLPPSFFSWT